MNTARISSSLRPAVLLLLLGTATVLTPRMLPAQQSPSGAALSLSVVQTTFETRALACLQPLDDLHEQFTTALGRIKDQARASGDTALVEAVDASLNALERGLQPGTSARPEVQQLLTILHQQTALRTKAAAPLLLQELSTYKAALQALKAAPANGTTTEPPERVEAAIELADQDERDLNAGVLPWTSARGWRQEAGDLKWTGQLPVEKRAAGIFLSSAPGGTPRLETEHLVRPPFEVEMRVIPDKTNLRFYFARGRLIFNWEMQPTQLRVHAFKDDRPTPYPDKPLKAGVLQTIHIQVRPDGTRIHVDGVLFHEDRQDNSGLHARIGVGPANGSKLELQSFRVRQEGGLRRVTRRTSPTGVPGMTGTTLTSTPTSTTSPGPGIRPPADATWPRTVGVEDTPEVIVVEENPETKSFIYRSPNYEFVCDSRLGTNVVREFGRIFEATYLVNCRLPLDIQPQPERLKTIFTARIYTHKEDYFAAGSVPGSAGVYSSAKKSIQVPLSSLGVKMVGSRVSLDYNDQDQHTLIHEITHQMMNHWLGKLPTWLIEGSAEYVAWADYDRGKFSFARMERRIPEKIGRRGMKTSDVRCLSLSELMSMDPRTWSAAVVDGDASMNYATAALLTYYFYTLDDQKDGAHVIACFKAIRNDTPASEAIATHLMRGRSHAELEKELTSAFKREGLTLNFVSRGSAP